MFGHCRDCVRWTWDSYLGRKRNDDWRPCEQSQASVVIEGRRMVVEDHEGQGVLMTAPDFGCVEFVST